MVPDAAAVANGISIDDAVSSYQRHLRVDPGAVKVPASQPVDSARVATRGSGVQQPGLGHPPCQ